MAATAAIFSAGAQELSPMRWEGVYTNRFWDNWEVAAAGGNSLLQISQKSDNVGKFWDRNSWNANIAVSKWFVPSFAEFEMINSVRDIVNASINNIRGAEGLYGEYLTTTELKSYGGAYLVGYNVNTKVITSKCAFAKS